jgi:putative ABC transport system permease protein
MIRNYIKIAVRTLLKHKGYTIINVLGLAIGLASTILILLFIHHEVSYDKHHRKSERIYRICTKGKIKSGEFEDAKTTVPLYKALTRDYPVVEKAVRIYPGQKNILKVGEKTFMEDKMFFADSTLFDVFTMPMLKGNPDQALTEPNKVVITEATAKKLFGTSNSLGKVIELGKTGGELEVTGVIKDCPENSHFHYNMFVSFVSSPVANQQVWLSFSVYTYILLQEEANPLELENHLPELVDKHIGSELNKFMGTNLEKFHKSGDYYGFFLQPLSRIHLHSNLEGEIEANGSINNVYFFSILAVFLTVIAAINFMNLSTAKSANRVREVGIRKVSGARRKQLIFQFLAEALLITFLALILSALIVELVLPYFSHLTGINPEISYLSNPGFIIALFALWLFVGILAGSYPAFYLSSFIPARVLKGKIRGNQKNFRKSLVVFQFTMTIILIISTFTISKQMQYIRKKNLGFNKENVMIINRANSPGDKKQSFKQELLKKPEVVNASYSYGIPGNKLTSGIFYPENSDANDGMVMSRIYSDPSFDDTYNLKMAKGRYFFRDYSTDRSAAVINEEAAKKLGYEEPLGKKIHMIIASEAADDLEFQIIGVVKDFNFASLYNTIQPLVITYANDHTNKLSVKLHGENMERTIEYINNQWNELLPDQPFNYSFLDNTWENKYRNEKRAGTLFKIFSLLAIFIACMGLLGLAAFMAEQRKKEIGVRKVFGASIANVIQLLIKEIVVLTGIASLLAWPVAYFFMKDWLQDFAYKINLSFAAFLLAAIIAMLIAFLTTGFRSYRAAAANPANSLRDE